MRQTGKSVSPMSNEGRNTYVINHITDALLKLMAEKPIGEISISELCELAGVGRASFYRNFETKEAVVERHLRTLLQEWMTEYERAGDPADFSESLLKHFYQNKDLYLLLYQRGMSSYIYDMIRWGTKMEEAQNNAERYVKSTVAGLIFGAVDEWMRLGMQETPEEIAVLFKKHET